MAKGFDVVQVEMDSNGLVDMINGITQPNANLEGLFFDMKCVELQLR